MVTNNKVLTVSYGTFSCTLEGFEESFDTMKAIAEYFRDLAADDRYFGAEPPTPDAEMLTRIAEREIERRVQARHEHGAIVLSATDPRVAADAPAPAEPVAEAAAAVAPEIEADTQDAADEAIADAVTEAALQDDVQDDAADAPVEVEAEASDAEEASVEEIVEDEIEEPVADAATETVEETVAENLFDEDFDQAPRQAAAPAEDDAEDSIAAKLRRIRAVVSRAEVEDDDDDDFIEDQHAEDMTAEADIEPTPVMQDVDEDDDAEDALEVEMPAAAAPAPAPRARVIRMKRAEFEEAIADGLIEEDHQDNDANNTVAPAAPSSSLSDEDEADLMAQLAEVDAEIQVEAPQAEEEGAVATEAEAEFEDDMPIPVTPKRARRNRRAALETQEAGEEAVDRLIEEANSKLDEPEGNRRRNAIAHLRAAVAATKAEKDAGSSLSKEDNSDAYRDDLASAMRPKKARSDEETPARRSAAPLKLVAAQRIDQPEDTAAKPVRPRRVAVDDVAAMDANEKSADFVEFAENMGATQLPDVLEAAASYLTFVEGRRRFSRPMLMRLAYQVGDERFEREAGLRSFGQLLRDKKIEKIAGGRFTVSDSINFKPEDGDREVG